MINKDRIVPVTGIDLISLYGLIIKITGNLPGDLQTVETDSVDGTFTIKNSDLISEPYRICSEPVKSFAITDADDLPSEFNIYFVPAYDYTGFTADGTALTVMGDEVEADGKTLYVLSRSENENVIAKVGF